MGTTLKDDFDFCDMTSTMTAADYQKYANRKTPKLNHLPNTVTKSDISKSLKDLRKYGFLVFTFNAWRGSHSGNKGFPDHVILKGSRMYFLEVKIGKDKLSKEQKEFWKGIIGLHNPNVFYQIVTENNYQEIIKIILQ